MLPGLGGMDPRQMAMAMKRMGIDMRDVPDVVEVVVRTPSKEYVFSKPAVSIMKAQGQETWQVMGSPKVREASHQASAAPAASTPKPSPGTGSPAAAPGPSSHASLSPPSPAPLSAALAPPSFTEEDVQLVMEQGHCTRDAARAALSATGGDLAEAILKVSKA